MKSLKDTPAGIADPYTERIKTMRANEIQELDNSEVKRPVKHIRTAMIEFIESVADECRRQDEEKSSKK